MKSLLILIFAVFVTTRLVEASEQLVDQASNFSRIGIKIASYEDDDDAEPLEQCSERSKGSFTLFDYSVVIAMLAGTHYKLLKNVNDTY